jgi:GT2 family glycosyltransferase
LTSIIIVNWNTRDLLAQCLQSIYDTTSNLDFEVVVVDNASTDGSQAMVRQQFPHIHLIANREEEWLLECRNSSPALKLID